MEQVPICESIGLTREAGTSQHGPATVTGSETTFYVTGGIWEGVVERRSGVRRTACLAITVRPASDGDGDFSFINYG